ncbi:multidrug effflux MFS transporter [Brachybacterium sp. J153]|uniref:multidrug effflux MFS transporter n=1 Tax=Brachybacterium sp. J153 TaxID=3116488 RepID=UPI002E76101B|nr:multidrug effflux MFS transporter [Brachybacterium sp. J153]MEE1617757.1 multidrug effflux MFS transporter [Brachybacterium sp. J153]
MTTTLPAPTTPVIPKVLPWILLLLTVFGPISMDLYLPALPALTAELGAVTSVAQLTVTACLLGLASGQLLAGPASDQYGRRRILLLGVAAYVVFSTLCALSPSIELLIAARYVQGLAGGVGVVIAQAAGRDLFDGRELIRFYGRLAVAGPTAAIVGPLIGGLLNVFFDWRGLFGFLAVVGVVLLILSATLFTETLPPERRSSGGLGRTGADLRVLIADRVFVGAVLTQGFVYAAIFAYLAGSTFVLQEIYGLSPQGYAAAFALNSTGAVLGGWTGGRLAERWNVHGALFAGIGVTGLGALGLLLAGLAPMPLAVVVASLFLLACGAQLASPAGTTLALREYPQMAGTAGSILGTARFGFGAISAPFVGIAGSLSILPLGVITTGCAVLAVAAGLLTLRRRPALVEEPVAAA